MKSSLERFLRYVKIDTQADDTTGTTPSTEKQKNLGRLLVKELLELGLNDAEMDEFGNVYAHLKGKDGSDTIGLNAHMDTALEVTDLNVNPKIVENYQGNSINLNENIIFSPEQFPILKTKIGKTLVTTDGTTLLGADDKAGIAIIMSTLEYLTSHPEVEHKNISICFTVDEEIGEGPLHFNLEKMNADYAFTLDGSNISGIDYENFNAKGVELSIKGVAVHPGEGKNSLINAMNIAGEFLSKVPEKEIPFYANEDEGYYHFNSINGNSEFLKISMILRDFDKNKLDLKEKIIRDLVNDLSKKYPKAILDLSIDDQYENMRPYVEKDPRPFNLAKEAIIKNGLTPVSTKIRGGTDGATFSKMGLVTPNLGTGSYNHHGIFEFLVVEEFEKMIEIVIDILKI